MGASIFLSKANENLQAAQLCHTNNLYNASANRAYYAMFQAAVAILLAHGFEFEHEKHLNHARVRSLFVNELINRRKIIQSKFKSCLYDVEIVRSQADYKPVLIGKKKAERQIRTAQVFINTINKELSNASKL